MQKKTRNSGEVNIVKQAFYPLGSAAGLSAFFSFWQLLPSFWQFFASFFEQLFSQFLSPANAGPATRKTAIAIVSNLFIVLLVLVTTNITAIKGENLRRRVKIFFRLCGHGLEIKLNPGNNDMLSIIPDLPLHEVGVKATGEVTSQGFNAVVMPAVDSIACSTDKISYLFYLDTDPGKFTAGAWAKRPFLV